MTKPQTPKTLDEIAELEKVQKLFESSIIARAKELGLKIVNYHEEGIVIPTQEGEVAIWFRIKKKRKTKTTER